MPFSVTPNVEKVGGPGRDTKGGKGNGKSVLKEAFRHLGLIVLDIRTFYYGENADGEYVGI